MKTPWHVQQCRVPTTWDSLGTETDFEDIEVWEVVDASGLVIEQSDDKAFCQLVAAAPDLLEALERCLPFIDDAEDIVQFYPDSAARTDCRTAVAAARAAIAKARGQ